ncbi:MULTISPECIES: hypothetical protein [Lysobacter]|jgi:hypothetical protein|uniref:hypothetical protein n=1 Tax=Lysobacter TaxID=68 RepID=UPI001F231206|nr:MULTISPECIES: hypothetical protein [Lysobacter]UJB17761.1 hypothetical protein L1A79_15480 [Lysobacter capsici]UJQ28517.1 hypothetical protein L2D09_24410 [Lysobacter gummosus]
MKQVYYGVGVFVAAFAIGAGLAHFGAPGDPLAMLIGGAMLAVGVIVGYKALEAVALLFAPIVLARMAVRWAATGNPLPREQSRERGVWAARLIFIPVYGLYALVTGGIVGAFPGGHGIFLSGLLFGFVGLLFAGIAVRIVIKYFD